MAEKDREKHMDVSRMNTSSSIIKKNDFGYVTFRKRLGSLCQNELQTVITKEMSREGCGEINNNNTKKQNENLGGDSMKMERSNNNNTQETLKKLKINKNGGIKVKKGESIEKMTTMEKRLLHYRDFLNNMCNRGSRCKFYHPPSIVRQRASQQTPEGIEYRFCIDYQNSGCHRDNCRYVHAHREDVNRYKMAGEVTLNLAREIAAVYNCDTINGIPFCKGYQTGSCSRGGQRCRYWHINVKEERERPRGSVLGLPCSAYTSRRCYPYRAADAYDSYGKRVRYDLDSDYVLDLERKNAELSKEVEGLKRELARERERYGDLYALFRQRNIITTTQQDLANIIPISTAYYQATSSTGWTETRWTH
ncbi:Zinc finger CCCH domain-containing protein 10 [Dirofilaria immitis]|nr:Zinc finger CCCH domain-containing protein 10 [Dirofilaria immitis]